MPSIYQLKSRFQGLLRPIVRQLASHGITANQVTLSALFASILVGGLLCLPALPRLAWLIVPVFMFIRMALNAIDGMLAREHNQKSALGGVLNELGDVLADTALFLPFAFINPQAALWVIAAVFMAMLTELVGLIGPLIGASRRYDGPMGKSDRAFIFGAFALAYALIPAAERPLPYLMGGCVLLMVFTCLNRIRAMLNEVQHA
ncbi:CDP-alcohol phosphatidyltransferase family protein [Chitinilyticum aquatile]|uniref:CDP-alcohol phosphatidyltransferase family protein n=1 Tax=Chitinilyticum aquatile TaxID=362520 RepID=UPI0003FE4B12|nr:CDP-alcohol phosphatidyltransferase family protein [Chitinilyticum aquatile]